MATPSQLMARIIDLFGPAATASPTALYGNLMVSPSGNILLGQRRARIVSSMAQPFMRSSAPVWQLAALIPTVGWIDSFAATLALRVGSRNPKPSSPTGVLRATALCKR
jgi:chaperone required for assembly of F1-ATPase